MAAGIVRRHVLISGKVQGVWYRQSTKDAADRIGGLSGWVKNRVDGRVEALMQGPADNVQRLIEWCHDGPAAAEVEAVAVSEEPVGELPDGFRVVR